MPAPVDFPAGGVVYYSQKYARLPAGGQGGAAMPAPERPNIAGEPRLTERIRAAAARGALSHAIILSGTGGDLAEAARFTAAALECEGDGPPCGRCGPCRKVLRGVHPDVVTVEDPEHRNIAVEVLRRTAADAYVLPNEGKRKVYIFPDCERLDPKAQNVLLKVVEEGPPRAAFLFCAKNSAVLLPTIRSRAVEWKLSEEARPAAADGDARRLLELFCAGNAAEMAAFCAELENRKPDRETLRGILSDARDLAAAGLAAACGVPGDEFAALLAERAGRRRLAKAAEVLDQFTRACQYNINAGQLTGALAVALTE